MTTKLYMAASFAASLLGGMAAISQPVHARGGDACAENATAHQPSDPDDTAAIERAIATGRCVHLTAEPGHELIVSHDIVIKTPGQLIYGDGRIVTRIRSGDPHGFSHGLFVAATGEPGPIFRDLGVFYNQPDISSPAGLLSYPPAFAMDATPRFRLEHVGCYLAITCVEARNNSGGAALEDVQLTAFHAGVDVDDALDSVRLENIHWGPFYLSPKLRALFLDKANGAVGIRLGRVDDFHIVDGTFYGGLGLLIRASAKDGTPGFGSIRGNDFDAYDGIRIEAVSTVNIVGNEFTLAVPGGASLTMVGGTASIVGNTFLLAVPARPLVIQGGMATVTANNFAMGAVDATLLAEGGFNPRVVFSNNIISAGPLPAGHLSPLVEVRQGDLVAVGNLVSPLPSGAAGTFVKLDDPRSDAHIGDNAAAGWGIAKP